jgi:hypothetical protein
MADTPRMGNAGRRLLLCALGVLSLGYAPAAHAAALNVDYTTGVMSYAAAAGEENRLTVSFDATAKRYVVFDRGVASTALTVVGAASPCSVVTKGISCPAEGLSSARISLGDLGDRLEVDAALPVTAEGGPGPDKLIGGSDADKLAGNGGGDKLTGGGGADVLSGGVGIDKVDYEDAAGPVTVTPDGVADDGEAGEGDNVGTDVEDVEGGPGNDVLHTPVGGGEVEGGPGDDTLLGGPGPDELDGGVGVDRFEAGAGDDEIASADGIAEQLSCGDGADAATNDLIDVVAPDCETFVSDGTSPPPSGDSSGDVGPAPDIVLPRRPVEVGAPGILKVTLGCDADAASVCRGDIYVEIPARYLAKKRRHHRHAHAAGVHAARGHYVARQRRLGHRHFRIAAGKTVSTRVPLRLRGHYVLRNRRKRIRGRIVIVQRNAAGKVLGRTTRPIVLERKWARRGISRRR